MIRSILRIPEDKLDSLGTAHKLTAYDRKLLEDLIEILMPFESATHCIQGNKAVTSSMIVPCIQVLKASMTKLSPKFSNSASTKSFSERQAITIRGMQHICIGFNS